VRDTALSRQYEYNHRSARQALGRGIAERLFVKANRDPGSAASPPRSAADALKPALPGLPRAETGQKTGVMLPTVWKNALDMR
jgi:hypothetical protein